MKRPAITLVILALFLPLVSSGGMVNAMGDPDRLDKQAFISAVNTYVIIELRTQKPTDDLLAVKIVQMLGRPVRDIYMMIYYETGGNVPEILLPFYPFTELDGSGETMEL